MNQEIVWTVLPNGRAGDKVKATLFVAPLLSGGPTLESFPLFLNWPAQLVDEQGKWRVAFKLHFKGTGVSVSAQPASAHDAPATIRIPDPHLWPALFPSETFVRGFKQKDLSQRRIHTFPIGNIKSSLKKFYRHVATSSPTRPPLSVDLFENKNLKLNDVSLMPPNEIPIDGHTKIFVPSGLQQDYQKRAKTESQRLGKKITADDLRLKDIRQQVQKEVNRQFLDSQGSKVKVIPVRPPNARNDFMQLRHFTMPHNVRPLKKKITPHKMDFHEMLTAYGQYPILQRQLGLAIDIEFSTPLSKGSGLVWVEVTPQNFQTSAPRTHYRCDADAPEYLGFSATIENKSDLKNRCLQLKKNEYQLEHMDVVGAGEKTMSLAGKLQQESANRSADTQTRTVLPSLQTAGISLIRTGRAVMYHNYFKNQQSRFKAFAKNQSGLKTAGVTPQLKEKTRATIRAQGTQPVVELWADDLVRGYRIDILDGTSQQWRSLCRRHTFFKLNDNGMDWSAEYEGNDGWISLAVTESTDKDDNDLYLQESLFRWSGWGLVAPRPGNTLDLDYQSAKQQGQAAQSLNISIVSKVAQGSLPRLRFGAPYKVRARAVDLAGNSLSLTEANDLIAGTMGKDLVIGEQYRYRRYEPVAQPVVLAHDPLVDSNGESMERIVIRSLNKEPSLDKVVTKEISQRHIVPTGASQLMAEMHGKFDDEQGRPQTAFYNAIIGHDNPLPNKDGVYHQPNVPLTFLPDPAASGAAFAGLPTKDEPDSQVISHSNNGESKSWPIVPPSRTYGRVHQVDFGPGKLWPELKSFRFKLAGSKSPQNPQWDARQREFTVFLWPGEIRKVRISSYISEKELDKFEIWGQIKKKKADSQLKSKVLAGLHWMITPVRELTLVHAVQEPLVTPQFNNLRSARKQGETWTTLADTFPIDGRSTNKIDIHAEWKDIIDTGPQPKWINGKAHAFELEVDYSDTEVRFGPERAAIHYQVNPKNIGLLSTRQELKLKQSKHQAKPRANRRIQANQPTTPAVRTGLNTRKKQQVISQAAKRGFAQRKAVVRYLSRHNFGDTRYRRISYQTTATTRFLEYMPFFHEYQKFHSRHRKNLRKLRNKGSMIHQWEEKNPDKVFTRRSKPVTVDVLSSARPPTPEVEYVIPTFGWKREKDGQGIRSQRIGGGLRVYLKRPWFTSGAGELLGVVVMQTSRKPGKLTLKSEARMNELKPYITQWGMDPIWRSAPTPQAWTPGLNNFRNAHKTESDLTLKELPGMKVSVAGYQVGSWDQDQKLTGYDEQRRLWFSDIEIDPGKSYYPFVRLALARYQPNSISWKGPLPGDTKLSNVVLADFAQLAPDRFASVTFVSETTLRVAVSGFTYSESGADAYASPNMPVKKKPLRTTLPVRNSIKKQVLRQSKPMADIGEPIFQTQKGGSTMKVNLEISPTSSTEPLTWLPVPQSTVELKRFLSKNSWIGEITLPEPKGSNLIRLVIKEYEWFVNDRPGTTTGKIVRLQTKPRLVYADALEI